MLSIMEILNILDVIAYFKKNILAHVLQLENIHRKAIFFREFVYAIALARKSE